MKKLLLPILILFLLVNSISAQGKTTIIKGKIIGEVLDKIEYTIPINGISNRGVINSIMPDASGIFEIKVNIDNPAFVQIYIPNQLLKIFIIEPKEKYELTINLAAKIENKMLKVICKTEEAQKLYSNIGQIAGNIEYTASSAKKDKTIAAIEQDIQTQKLNDMSGFKTLLTKKKISQKLFDLIQNDRDCYYAALTTNILFVKLLNTKPEDFNKFPIEVKQFWGEVFKKVPISEKKYMSSPFWFEYMESYIKFKIYAHKDFDVGKVKEFKKMAKEGIIHSYILNEAKKHISATLLEHYIAGYLIKNTESRRYEKEFIDIFEGFKKEYPNSKYITFLQETINSIIAYHKKAEQDFNKEIHFVEKYESVNSLKEVLSSFKGKKVYIDVWATWCGPCKDEFKYKVALSELLKKKDVEILYISIDKDRREIQWKKMIKYYDLKGYHIRANKNFVKDFQRLFDKKGSITIPWYLLIDEKGNIVKKHAKRPSELQELEKELNEI